VRDAETQGGGQRTIRARQVDRKGLTLAVQRASAEEQAAHEAKLKEIAKASGGKCLWTVSGEKQQ